MGKNTFHLRPESREALGGGPRGNCKTKQSQGSRKREMVALLEWEEGPQAWHTLTFPDEDLFLYCKDLEYMARHVKRCINRLLAGMAATWPGIQYHWKVDWKRRKNGMLQGQYAAHIHLFWRIPGATRVELHSIAIKTVECWGKAIRTQVFEKLMQVNLFKGICREDGSWRRKPSYEWLEGTSVKAVKYACKYTSKVGEDLGEVNLGRLWGRSKSIKPADQQYLSVQGEEVWFQRILRRKWKKSARKKSRKAWLRLKEAIRRWSVWGIETPETVTRMMACARQLHDGRESMGEIPF